MIEERAAIAADGAVQGEGRTVSTGWLRAGDLKFDWENYQRDPHDVSVARIADHWNEDAVHTIVVSRRSDGSYWVIDGQQRSLAAIRRWGADRRLKAEIHEGLTLHQEAQMFAEMNSNRKPVPTLMRYHAWWSSGHPEVCAIAELLDSMNLKYPWQGGDEDRSIVCWVALHNLVRRTSIEHLSEVMAFIEAAWQCERHSLEGHFIQGVSFLLRRHAKDEGWDKEEGIKSFQRVAASVILKLGRELRVMQSIEKPHPAAAVYQALHRTYNKGRRTRRLAELPTGRLRV